MTDMNKPNSKTTVEKPNVEWGVFVWQNADGTALSDGEGRVLSMNGYKGDLDAVRQMRDAATALGSGDGNLAFIPGSKKVSDAEHDDQMEAFIEGRPIPGDIGEVQE